MVNETLEEIEGTANPDLTRLADAILASAGFRRDGRPRRSVAPEQTYLERSIIATPQGGQPGYRR